MRLLLAPAALAKRLASPVFFLLPPSSPARGGPFIPFFAAVKKIKPLFLCQAFDHRPFVDYTLLAGILDPFFGEPFVVPDIPRRKTRFLPQCCGWAPSPGSSL